ncbi:hypothetical protein AAEY27_19325 [Kosakonia sp. BYX6]|uniref:Uncharacterized protein n=1 Tax=Kosakonia calanthes TaxID=3139408 RepID=A0ABZ3B8I9_9ENTR
MRFYQVDPSQENYWRGVILFGNNFAAYKFALAHALYDIERSNAYISLQDMALPFRQHICAHLKQSLKQILNTTKPGPFITACLRFNKGEIAQDELLHVPNAGLPDVMNNLARAETRRHLVSVV